MNNTPDAQRRGNDLAQKLARCASDQVRRQIGSWLSYSTRFASFCERHRDKISAKFQGATTSESKRDVHAELEIAFRLLGVPTFDVDGYEPEGKKKKGPDFHVSTLFGDFYAEVKRIREVAATSKFKRCVDQLYAEVRNLSSSLYVSLCFGLSDALEEEYADALSQASDPLVCEVVEAVRRYEKDLEVGASASFHSTVFPDLEVELIRDDKSPPGSVSVPIYPNFYTQRESLKYTQIIVDSLLQLREKSRNVLLIVTHSDAHTPEQLEVAVEWICKRVREGDEAFFKGKGFEGIHDFRRRFSVLSAVVVMGCGMTDNLVWPNANGPGLDAELLGLLRHM